MQIKLWRCSVKKKGWSKTKNRGLELLTLRTTLIKFTQIQMRCSLQGYMNLRVQDSLLIRDQHKLDKTLIRSIRLKILRDHNLTIRKFNRLLVPKQ